MPPFSLPDEMGTEMVAVLVGAQQHRFVLHKKLLVSQSSYFRAALASGQRQSGKVVLADADPAAFKLLVEFLYTGSIASVRERATKWSLETRLANYDHEAGHKAALAAAAVEQVPSLPEPAGASTDLGHQNPREFQLALLKAVVLCEVLCWEDCFNTAIDAFIAGEVLFDRHETPVEFISLVYQGTREASPVRRLMVDMVGVEANRGPLSKERSVGLAACDRAFAADMLGRAAPSGFSGRMPATAIATLLVNRIPGIDHYPSKPLKRSFAAFQSDDGQGGGP